MLDLYGGFGSQQAIDAAYDVEGAADMVAYEKWFVESSERARRDHRCNRSVPYGPTVMEHSNVFPAAESNSPILVYLHGGAWRSLSADIFDLIAPGPIAAGFAVVNVTYALCPSVTISEIVRQARAAVAWAARNAASFNGNPDRIFVAGHSAGGHLAAMCALTSWSRDYGLPDDLVKGVMPISGLFDLEPVSLCFMQSSLRLTGDQIMRESPLRHVRPLSMPMTVIWGEQELQPFKDQAAQFGAAWREQGNVAEDLVLNKDHFNILDGFQRLDGALTEALIKIANKYPGNSRKNNDYR